MEIGWQNPNRYPEAAARRLRPWLARLVGEVAPASTGAVPSLGVRFAGDRLVRRANRIFRGQDKTTDVLSFPAGAMISPAGTVGGRPREGEQCCDVAVEDYSKHLLDLPPQPLADPLPGSLKPPGPFPAAPGGKGTPPPSRSRADPVREVLHLGDILISVPQARRQARSAGGAAERELKVLLLHGLLHCMGYDHETDGGEMERLERRLRRAWVDHGGRGGPGGDSDG